LKLLVVDDSLVVRNAVSRGATGTSAPEVEELAREVARSIGNVLVAEDGEQAVALFHEHRPEMVTMDLTMPRLDGLRAIGAIRALEPRTSILVISALNSLQVAMKAIRLGACGFLTKPFTEVEITEALDQLVDHARAHGRG
jgi:two-component system chemotaxis response regulator CheY